MKINVGIKQIIGGHNTQEIIACIALSHPGAAVLAGRPAETGVAVGRGVAGALSFQRGSGLPMDTYSGTNSVVKWAF